MDSQSAAQCALSMFTAAVTVDVAPGSYDSVGPGCCLPGAAPAAPIPLDALRPRICSSQISGWYVAMEPDLLDELVVVLGVEVDVS
jgi:hypothetical protein